MKYLIIAENNIPEIEDFLTKLSVRNTWCIVKSFEEAVPKVYEWNPAFILADNSAISLAEVKALNEDDSIPLIYLSNNASDAVEAYSLGDIADFILTPVTYERLVLAIKRAFQKRSFKMHMYLKWKTEPLFVFLKTGHVHKKFLLDEIVFIESSGANAKIVTTRGKFHINDSLIKIERKLLFPDFVRVHKSYIINTSKIVSFDSSGFELTLGNIPVGLSYKPHLTELYRTLLNEME